MATRSPTRHATRRIALGIGLAVNVAACAQSVQELTESASYTVLPPEEEEQLGERMATELEREVELLENPAIQRYVAELGREVAAQAATPAGIEYTFKVIDAPDVVNAVTLPGGEIYVYSGLLEAADSEAELVAVLAHEVAHVAERHIASQLVTQYGLQTLAGLALGAEPGQIQQLVAAIVAQGTMLQFSRDAEREADELGLYYVVSAGWSPQGYVDFFQKLAREDVPAPSFLRSHPAPDERVRHARELMSQFERLPERTGRERYQDMMRSLRSPEVADAPAQTIRPPSSSLEQ